MNGDDSSERVPVSAEKPALDVAAIRARCEAATPGPWRYDGDNTVHADKVGVIVAQIPDHPQDDGPYEPEQIGERSDWYRQSARNAGFIEAAREDIPALLAALEAAQAEIAALRARPSGYVLDLIIDGLGPIIDQEREDYAQGNEYSGGYLRRLRAALRERVLVAVKNVLKHRQPYSGSRAEAIADAILAEIARAEERVGGANDGESP